MLEVRNRKIQELNRYKEAPTEKKYKDIQMLLGLMNDHSKLPKADASDREGGEISKMTN